MVDNTPCISNSGKDDIRIVSASRLEHLLKQVGDESFDPVEDLDSSSKARETESKRAVVRKVETYGNSFCMVGFPLVVCSQNLVLGVFRGGFVHGVPFGVGVSRL